MPTEKKNDVTVEIVKPVFSSQLWVVLKVTVQEK